VKICADKTKTINILEISGTENSSIAKERAQGFREGILRNENFESINVSGMYPCGEGAGYAGGIVSAAVDGITVAEQIIERCNFL